jgi:replicative DNA helicase
MSSRTERRQEAQPLHRIEVESSVIGALLVDPNAFERVEGVVSAADFYAERNRILFDLLLELWERNVPIDTPTVLHELQIRGDLLHAGGAEYLLELDTWSVNAANIEQHARIVREMSQRRQLVEIGTSIADLARSEKKLLDVLDRSEQMVFAVSSQSNSDALQKITGDLIMGTLEKKAAGDFGVMTGFRALDHLTLGFLPGELWILAGAPSMGKTAFALQMSVNAAEKHGPVAIFTMEMMKEELVWRMLCAEAAVDGQEFRRKGGKIGLEAEEALASAAAYLNTLPLYLDESSSVTVTHVRANSRRLAAAGKLSLIVIDHLQIMDDGDEETRAQRLATVTRGLKGLAKDLRVPVVLLSQLSRFKERADKRPQLSDLRESGAIEQDANGVIFLYRPEYYFGDHDKEGNSLKGVAEAIVGKSRNGATGSVTLYFREEFARFENLLRT